MDTGCCLPRHSRFLLGTHTHTGVSAALENLFKQIRRLTYSSADQITLQGLYMMWRRQVDFLSGHKINRLVGDCWALWFLLCFCPHVLSNQKTYCSISFYFTQLIHWQLIRKDLYLFLYCFQHWCHLPAELTVTIFLSVQTANICCSTADVWICSQIHCKAFEVAGRRGWL